MPDFDINPGVLNNVAKPLVGRSLDLETADNNTALRTMIEDFFAPDSLAETGPYKGVILRVESTNTGKAEPEGFLDSLWSFFGGNSKQVRVKARIPELHSHLPVPTGDGDPQTDSYADHHIIDMYPTFTAQNDDEIYSKVVPGSIGVFDFGDRKNYTDAMFITPLDVQAHRPSPGSSQGSFTTDCSPPTGVSSGKPLPGNNASSQHTGITEDNLRSRQAGAKAIMIGDSQMAGNIGRALQGYVEDLGYTVRKAGPFSAGRRMGRPSSAVRAWIAPGRSVSPPNDGKWGLVQQALRSFKPELVVIALGGNGCQPGQARKLIDKIRKYAENAKILWIGPPPAMKVTHPTEKAIDMFPYLKRHGVQSGNPPKLDVTNAMIKAKGPARKRLADLIDSEIRGLPNVFYVNTPKALGGLANDPGPKCDGIHATGKIAAEILKLIKKKASQAPAGTITPENAQKKPKAPNKSAPAPGNGASPLSKEVQDKIAPILTKEAQKIGNKKQARQYLLDYAKRAPTPLENIDSYLSRDWVSGFLATDGHVKGMTVDVSQWQPARIEEIAAWQGFTSHHESNIPRSPYGVEVVKPGRVSTGEVSQEDINPMGGPVDTRTLIKKISYSFAAAAYMVATGETQKSPDVKASPAATAAASTGGASGGGAAAGGGSNNCAKPVGGVAGSQSAYQPTSPPSYKRPKPSKYNDNERITLCQLVNKKLVQRGEQPVLLKYLMAFQYAESGNRKPFPGLVRFEPHVFYGDRYRSKTRGITKEQVPYYKGKIGSKCGPGKRPSPKSERKMGEGPPCQNTYLDFNSKNTKRPAFDRAAKYNLEAAFGSTSWGSFQVMGFNLISNGFIQQYFNGQIAEFLKQFDSDPESMNADMLVGFIANSKRLKNAMKRGDYYTMAAAYNGSGNAKRYEGAIRGAARTAARALKKAGFDPDTAT